MNIKRAGSLRILAQAGPLACALLACLSVAEAGTWYVPMTDSEPGGFDHIQILMAPGYAFDSPAMTVFTGPDENGDPSEEAESWAQTFLNDNRDFATADGPSSGYEFLAFSVWVDGDPQTDRPRFHYQTYLGDSLVGNYDVVCIGPNELDWTVEAGTWGQDTPVPPFLCGDFDRDTDVDIYDVTNHWQPNYTGPGGTGMQVEHGDGDGDGDVDIYDILNCWQPNYTGPHAPEPATLGLLLLGLGGLLKRRRTVR